MSATKVVEVRIMKDIASKSCKRQQEVVARRSSTNIVRGSIVVMESIQRDKIEGI